MSTRTLFPGDRGRWVRRGGSIVLLPSEAAGGEPQGEVSAPVTATQAGVIDPRIDVFAQRALLRMAKSPDPGARADASAMLGAVKSGRLAGIYKEDEQVPALRARRAGTSGWLVIPKGEDAALFLGAAPGEAPLIVFRDGVRSLPARLDPALRKAWASFVTVRAAGARCQVGTGGVMAEVGAPAGVALANVFPPVLCQLRSTPVPRLRVSTWASAQTVTAANMALVAGEIDDVSLLRTLTNDAGTPMGLVMDPAMRRPTVADPAAPGGSRVQTLQEVVANCRPNGIQVLAGYGIVPADGSDLDKPNLAAEKARAARFNDWLADPNRSPDMATFVGRIVAFLATGSLNPAAAIPACPVFDGISFDIETLRAQVADRFTDFCRMLAMALAPRGMIVAVAAGSKVTDTQAFRDPPGSPKGILKPAPASTRAVDWRMANGNPNLIIRPMAYDAGVSGATLEGWHRDIVGYALDTLGLSPAQLQLGVKTVKGNGLMGPDRVAAECAGLLRPRSVGLINFNHVPGGGPLLAGFNRALNAGAPARPAVGQPLQVPLSSLACLTSSDARPRIAAPRRPPARARR
jgi:hypothetical protein